MRLALRDRVVQFCAHVMQRRRGPQRSSRGPITPQNQRMRNPADQRALTELAQRRAANVPLDGTELRARIQALGDINLNDAGRHDAFRELYGALTSQGFRLMPFPDHSKIETTANRIYLEAVLVDEQVNGQVAGEIHRDFQLDGGFVKHELLRIQTPYRRGGLSHILLDQAFPFYRQIGLDVVVVHAALEAGRWHWARMGFVPVDADERRMHEAWSGLCLLALGHPPLPGAAPLSRLALLGYGPGGERTTLHKLHGEVNTLFPALRADPTSSAIMQWLESRCDARARAESASRWGWLDEARFRFAASANDLGYDDDVALGKAIMLAGPDWFGVFDLKDPVAQQVFDAEFQRKFSANP